MSGLEQSLRRGWRNLGLSHLAGGLRRRHDAPLEPSVDDGVPDVVVEHCQEVIEADVPVYPSVAELYLQARLGIHVHVFGRVCGACGERHDLCVVLHRAKFDEGEVDVALSDVIQTLVMLMAVMTGTSRRCLSRFESLLRTPSGSISGGFEVLYGCTRLMSVRSSPTMPLIHGFPSTLARSRGGCSRTIACRTYSTDLSGPGVRLVLNPNGGGSPSLKAEVLWRMHWMCVSARSSFRMTPPRSGLVLLTQQSHMNDRSGASGARGVRLRCESDNHGA
jgi:hypothetical protein